MSHNIIVEGGTAVRLKTAGTYCDRDIVVTAKGGAVAEPVVQPLEITENGTYTPPAGVDGYAPVTVNVAASGDESPTALLDGSLDGSLTYIDSSATSIIAYACRGLSNIKTVNIPNAISIGTYAFYYCTAMTSINAPKVVTLGTYAFYNCDKLKSVTLPNATSAPQNSFYSCESLEKADLWVAGTINQAAFAYCGKLTALILRKSGAICKLATATNALQGSAIAAGTGYVYVPITLLSDDDSTRDYRRATNWVNYAAQFRPLVDTVADLGGIDGTVYDRAWVDEDYCVYLYNGSGWEKET